MSENNSASAEQKVSFKDTLNLPTTDFPIRANSKEDDPALVARWQKEGLYEKSFMVHKGSDKFILHDGPPYANGHIHAGHAYNKILKDIVCKSQRMMGKQVPTIPGWDCHGLPIELKVTQENPGLKGSALKKACRAYAQKWIDTQKDEFKRLGVLMNWNEYYATMSFAYESSILRAFGEFVAQGFIERKNKTVPWCPSCQTVLAQAEIEYQDQKDPSIYVRFALPEAAVKSLFPNLANRTVSLLVWTTTPWTLPLNRAVLIKPHAEYVVLDVNDQLVIVAKDLADKICALIGVPKNVVAEFIAEQLVSSGAKVQHPFLNTQVPLILSETVSLDDGTAFVHCAPGCGPEDYEVGVKNNLEIFSPISPNGKYTEEVLPKELAGMAVTDGQIWVMKKLGQVGTLFHKTSIKHSYPHCWRSKTPLIFRATKQWFCNLSKNNLKENAVAAADSINALPEKSINRLKATLEGRLEWVLSRQRTWGVPIPALICAECDYTHSTPELINKVADEVAKHGIEYWDEVSVESLLAPAFKCPQCKMANFKKEFDILDVWFESGVSHYAVLHSGNQQQFPANMYLEGKDQHRAWFQSSLLTGMVLNNQPPMREIVTHGFTVDAQGRKMSKSIGNVVSPQEMIDQLGTDGLRIWASSIDISGEAVISKLLLDNVKEIFRKNRNTLRFLLSNLYNFDIAKDAVPFDQLMSIDQYALQTLAELNEQVIKAYADYDFTLVSHKLSDYCAAELSAFYLDIIKDRLYVEKANGQLRRSAQTACWHILDTLTKLLAPIMSFTAEQVADCYQKGKDESIHLQKFSSLNSVPAGIDHNRWHMLKEIRSAILKAIEGLREKGIVKHSLEAQVTIFVDAQAGFAKEFDSLVKDLERTGQGAEGFFKEFCIVSQFHIAKSVGQTAPSEYQGLSILVQKAAGDKCPRCWNWAITTNEFKLDARCQKVLEI